MSNVFEKKWDDWDMVGFAGYYSGRMVSKPSVTFMEALDEFKQSSKSKSIPAGSGTANDVLNSRCRVTEQDFNAIRKLKNPCQEKTISPMDYEYPNYFDYESASRV